MNIVEYRDLLIKTAKELIQPYIDDINLRSVGEAGSCRYNGLGGKHCAFAMACKPEMRPLLVEGVRAGVALGGDTSILTDINDKEYFVTKTVKKFLKEVYQEILDISFWEAVQGVHDRNESSQHIESSLIGLLKAISEGKFDNKS